ncbi:MAG: archaetidylserine decarboxylase [Methylococcaceae bacterium]
MTIKDALTTLPQYILPHHSLSRIMGKLTHSQNKYWKHFFISQIVKHYGVNMAEATEPNIKRYLHFNDFFTRTLNPAQRPIDQQANGIVSPADGEVSQCGPIVVDQLIQAKGKAFSVKDLVGGQQKVAEQFYGGQFATIYLSPKDYHRLHMPITGHLIEMIHIPGRLFSVNAATTRAVPNLFARNERVVAIFSTEAGPMALILVGAIFVASIETVWHGVVTPPTHNAIQSWRYVDREVSLEKGKEMGRFNMGSTIIVLFGKDMTRWIQDLKEGHALKLGQLIGEIKTS